jgi:hypothetical protein
MREKQFDNLYLGIFSGISAPVISFYIFCYYMYPDDRISDVLKKYIENNVLTHVLSLSLIANLILFFLFLSANNELSARGVLYATFIYAVVVIFLKFIK